MDDRITYLKISIDELRKEQKSLQQSIDLSSLLKLVELGIYPVEILSRCPRLMEAFSNRNSLPKIK